jgi:hypothetical protein
MRVFGRQAALVEVGEIGQARLDAAQAEVLAEGFVAEVAARYLAGAGVGRLRVVDPSAAASAREANPDVRVDVVEPSEADAAAPIDSLDLRDPSTRQLAAGALFALRTVRSTLGLGP